MTISRKHPSLRAKRSNPAARETSWVASSALPPRNDEEERPAPRAAGWWSFCLAAGTVAAGSVAAGAPSGTAGARA